MANERKNKGFTDYVDYAVFRGDNPKKENDDWFDLRKDDDFTLSDIIEYQKEFQWIVPNLIEEGSVVVLGGNRGTHKTFLALHLAWCLSMGIPVLKSDPSKKRKVRYMNIEHPDQAKKRIQALMHKYSEYEDEWDKKNLIFNNSKWEITENDFLNKWRYEVIAGQYDIVIIDTLSYILPDGDESKAHVLRQVLHWLAYCAQAYFHKPCTFILLHHTTQNSKDNLRGSSEIENIPSTVLITDGKRIKVKKQRNGKTGGTYAYETELIRFGDQEDDESLVINFTEPRKTLLNYTKQILEYLETLPDKSAPRADILAWYRRTNPDIKENTAHKHITRGLEQCVTEGLVTIKGKKNEEEYEVKYD
tara:strand:+ start:988 stop:2070 length:1083 start_codon:yes stop_codon:yes gene_type:complete